jgi:CRP/FNR family transcriptional regulator, cyclic AMP receptor protein
MADYESLRTSPLLQGLTDDQLAAFWDAGEVQTVRAGDAVVREGEVGDTMYILLEGVVEISQTLLLKLGRNDIGQKEKTLIRLEAHQRPCFGEMSLLEDAEERSATISSLTESKVLVLDRESFDKLTVEDPMLGCIVLKSMARTVSTRLRKANGDVLKLTTALSMALSNG